MPKRIASAGLVLLLSAWALAQAPQPATGVFVAAPPATVAGETLCSTGTVRYVKAAATGTGSGLDWTNAQALPTGTGFTRGTTYCVASGSYAGRTFSTAASGALVISVIGATAADHGTNTGWVNTMSVSSADGGTQATWTSSVTFSTSNWVFDGVAGPTWSQTPSQYGFTFGTNQSGHTITIANLSIAIAGIRVAHIASTGTASDVEKFFVATDNGARGVSQVTIAHNYVSTYQNGYWATSPGPTNADWTAEYNVFLNGQSSAGNHGEWINNNYAFMTNRITRFNLFKNGGNDMTGVVVANNNSTSGDLIYGNVVNNVATSNGVFTDTSGGELTNARIFNNTLVNTAPPNGNGWLGGGSPGEIVQNNLLYNMRAQSFSGADYNAYFSTTSTPSEAHGQVGSGNPFVNSAADDYHLLVATSAGLAQGLASPATLDRFGNVRGADGVIDRGAYEFCSGGCQFLTWLRQRDPSSIWTLLVRTR